MACKENLLNKKIKKYLLFGFMPICEIQEQDNEEKKYILGAPFSSFRNKGDCTVKRTFFQMFKKEESYIYI